MTVSVQCILIEYYIYMNDQFCIFQCPHCHDFIIVARGEINCTILRHAVYKNNFQQIDPHSSKELCMNLVDTRQVYGCAQPFRIVINDGAYYVEPCDYV